MVEKMEMREEVPEEEVEDDDAGDCFGNRKGAWRRKLSCSALA
jgi:hypothetical protein